MRTHLHYTLLFLVILFLPGCGRIIDWGKCVFYQGKDLDYALINRAHCYVRSISVYDQFSTAAIFDALLLNEAVYNAYKQLHKRRLGLGTECEEFDYSSGFFSDEGIQFIVLTSYESPLFTYGCPWSLFLEIDGCLYRATQIQGIDLPCEYQLFFGNRYNQFKVAYLVSFNVGYYAKNMKLIFRSATKEACMQWTHKEIQQCYCQNEV